MNYITRERVHVDRIATAWAIRKFVDADATFQFVPRTRDVRGLDGIPFDVRGAALTHRGGRCTFEVLLDTYGLDMRRRLTEPGHGFRQHGIGNRFAVGDDSVEIKNQCAHRIQFPNWIEVARI